MHEQDRQCSTMQRRNHCCSERAITITYFCMSMCLRVCSLTYPACNALAPYCLWPLGPQESFRHYLINGTIFWEKKKNVLNVKRVFWFSLQIYICNISHSKKNSARYCHKYENALVQSTRYSCQILMQLEFSRQIFEKKKGSYIKFHKNPSSGSRGCSMRMDRQTWRRLQSLLAILRTRLKNVTKKIKANRLQQYGYRNKSKHSTLN